jgi:hypothetical protein
VVGDAGTADDEGRVDRVGDANGTGVVPADAADALLGDSLVGDLDVKARGVVGGGDSTDPEPVADEGPRPYPGPSSAPVPGPAEGNASSEDSAETEPGTRKIGLGVGLGLGLGIACCCG